MIIQETTDKVKMSGSMETTQCQIKTDDGKMFHILSNLYSDPLGAVVRELSTNCMDGHKIAGNDKLPFDIQLPGPLDIGTFITFRDYGPGMSDDVVKEIFTTFGASTKSGSNVETGCLGLGSKSPLAISDSFTVTSVNSGIKTTYSVSKDDQRRPILSKFGSVETDEGNGLSVTVPLSKQHFSSLDDVIIKQLKYFEIKPNVYDGDTLREIEWEGLEKFSELSSTIFVRKEHYTKANVIVQGEIGYAFNSENFLGNLSNDESSKLYVDQNEILQLRKLFDDYEMRIFMPMGTVSFAPSREELIYDEMTLVNVLDQVRNTMKKFDESYVRIYSKIECLYQYQQMRSKGLSSIEEVVDLSEDDYKFILSAGFGFRNATKAPLLFDCPSEWLSSISSISLLDDIKDMKRYYEDGSGEIRSSSMLKKDRNSWSSNKYKSENILEYIDVNNYKDIKVIFLNPTDKLSTKHLVNYTLVQNENKFIPIIAIKCHQYSKKLQDEIIEVFGIMDSNVVAFAEVQRVSEKLIIDGRAPKKSIASKPRSLKYCKNPIYLKNVTRNWSDITVSAADIKNELRGVYIPTFNSKFNLSASFREDYSALAELIENSENGLKTMVNLFKEFDCDMSSVTWYAGNGKNFKNTHLIHFETYILAKIKKTRDQNAWHALNLETRKYSFLSADSSELSNVITTFDCILGTLPNGASKNLMKVKDKLLEYLPFENMFYKKDNAFKLFAVNFLKNRDEIFKMKDKSNTIKRFRFLAKDESNRKKMLEKLLDIDIVVINHVETFRRLSYEYSLHFFGGYRNVMSSWENSDEFIKNYLSAMRNINEQDFLNEQECKFTYLTNKTVFDEDDESNEAVNRHDYIENLAVAE